MIDSIAKAMEYEADYRPSNTTREIIGSVTLAAFVGPSAVGKNFNMQRSGFRQAGTITTREPRQGDQNYRYLSDQAMFDAINAGTLAQYGVFGSRGPIYATDHHDYEPSAINAMDTTYGGVEALIGTHVFKSVRPIGVLAPVDIWRRRLEERFDGQTPDKIAIRLAQAGETLAAIDESYITGHDRLVIVSSPEFTQANQAAIVAFIKSGYHERDNYDSTAQIVRDMIDVLPELKKQYT